MNESRDPPRGGSYTYECGIVHIGMRNLRHMNATSYTYEWGMLHIRMSHVTHFEKSYTYEWVTRHHTHMNEAHLRYGTHMNESRHTFWSYSYEWVIVHICTHMNPSHSGNLTDMNEVSCTYECNILHIWMRYGTHVNESRHTFWEILHIRMSHKVSHTYEWVTFEVSYTYERVMSHILRNLYTYEWVTRHHTHMNEAHLRYGTHMNESRHTFW